MKISVIIITRNRAKSLENCLRGLLEQELLPNEVIVVDSSTDKMKKVINSVAPNLNISHIFEMAAGVALARNIGIRNAKYENIAFIDDDCIPAPNWIKNIIEGLKQHPEIPAIGGKSINVGGNIYCELDQLLFSFSVGTQDFHSDSLSRKLKRYLLPYSLNIPRFIKTLPTRNIIYRKKSLKKLAYLTKILH